MVSVAVENSGGASLSYAGDMEERGAARVWEGVAGLKGVRPTCGFVVAGPLPYAPHYIGGTPSVGLQVFE